MAERLDQPRGQRRRLPGMRPAPLAERFGRWSEGIAEFIGSWTFIAYMTIFVITWLAWNTLAAASLRFDPWPFIGLTLMLSLQASYAAPLILLAANRQADRDRVTYADDRSRTEALLADSEFLAREVAALRMALGETATRDFLRAELRDLRIALQRSAAEAAGAAGATGAAGARSGVTPAGENQEPRGGSADDRAE